MTSLFCENLRKKVSKFPISQKYKFSTIHQKFVKYEKICIIVEIPSPGHFWIVFCLSKSKGLSINVILRAVQFANFLLFFKYFGKKSKNIEKFEIFRTSQNVVGVVYGLDFGPRKYLKPYYQVSEEQNGPGKSNFFWKIFQNFQKIGYFKILQDYLFLSVFDQAPGMVTKKRPQLTSGVDWYPNLYLDR